MQKLLMMSNVPEYGLCQPIGAPNLVVHLPGQAFTIADWPIVEGAPVQVIGNQANEIPVFYLGQRTVDSVEVQNNMVHLSKQTEYKIVS